MTEEQELTPEQFEAACRDVGNQIAAQFREIVHSLKPDGAKFSQEEPFGG